jgi:ribosomal protein L4
MASIDIRLSLIEATVLRLDDALNGTGNKPGLVEDHRTLQALVLDHLKRMQEDDDAKKLLAQETKDARELLASEAKESKAMLAKEVKEQREKMSGRQWAVVMAVIAAFITQTAGLVALFIRTGGIR